MYSIVLMAALATSPSTPAWCHGCHGCCYSGYCCSSYCCGGWGCCGGYGYHGCYSYSCCGCYGGYAWGGCYGCYSYACYGCYSGYGYYGYAAAPVVYAPVVYAAAPVTTTATVVQKATAAPGAATLVVEAPNDAKLYIDDQAMKTQAERRVFNTPKLDAGQTYYYELRAEVVRDGKTYTEAKRVTVRAGETTTAKFTTLTEPANKAVAAAGR